MTITRLNVRWFSRRSSTLRCAGFTLIEISAVVFIVAVLVSLLCAALNHTKSKALRVTCLDNLRQLQHAWWLYSGDNEDALPLNQAAPAPDDPRFPQFRTSNDSWVAGNARQDVSTANITRGSLFPYVGSVGVYRCPMDGSKVARRPDVLRTRSYSMNAFLGGDSDLTPSPKYKFGQIMRPDNAFVFIEEHEDSRWLANFVVPTSPAKGRISAASSAVWLSTPADRHGQGCNISFADGHIEYWRWYGSREPADPNTHLSSSLPSVAEARDLVRLQSCLP